MSQSPQTAPGHHHLQMIAMIGGTILIVAASLFAYGYVQQRWQTPPGGVTIHAPATSSSLLVVYIVGAIASPGTYHLPANSRIDDLVQQAGGLRPDADTVRINLAALLFDGEEVFVPRIGEVDPTGTAAPTVRVNINIASAATLHTQLKLTTKVAQAIVTYRETHGPFQQVDDLLKVPVSPTTFKRIRDQISVT